MARVADIIVEVLRGAQVRTVFGIPSIHNLALYEALRQQPDIRHVLCRQEATAVHMADGFARAGGAAGVVLASTGPGSGYAVPALQEAAGSCAPLLLITTDIPSAQIGRGLGALHELEGQAGLLDHVSKAVFVLQRAEQARALTRQALQTALAGRPGPVCLQIPTDILAMDFQGGADAEGGAGLQDEPARGLDRAVSLIRGARQPLIMAGISTLRAGLGSEVRALAEGLAAPVLTTTQAKGLLAEDHPCAFGNVARRGVISDMVGACDLALAVGTRLRAVDTRRRGLKLPRLVHVDWDERWMGRNYDPEIALSGDIRKTTRALLKALGEAVPEAHVRRARLRDMQARVRRDRARIRSARVEMRYLETLRSVLPRESILVTDSTVLGYWAEYFYPTYVPGGLITPRGSSIIGFGFPAAAGVRLAREALPVVALVGDGGFLYGAQEMATCARHGIGLPVIVVNDEAFGVIGHLQRSLFGREHEHRLHNPDFPALARSYGAEGVRAEGREELADALRQALESRALWLIELKSPGTEPPYGKY